MKLQTLPMFLFIMSKVKAAEYNDHNDHSPNVFDVPVCVTFSPIKFQGDDTIVNTDKSAGRSITIGDLTIEDYAPLLGSQDVGVPNQPGGFTDIDVTYDGECVFTKGSNGPPACSYIFQMSFCRDHEKDCRFGTFTAYGIGRRRITINGGTDDFLGAFGQITPTSPFRRGRLQSNGNIKNIVGSRIDLRIQLCYYKDYIDRPKETFSRIGAVDYDFQKGTRTLDGGSIIGSFDHGDFVTFRRINFGHGGMSKRIVFRYSKGGSNNEGRVEIRVGGSGRGRHRDGRLIGQFVPKNTGDWREFTTCTVDLDDRHVSGFQDLTLVGIGDINILNLVWLELSA